MFFNIKERETAPCGISEIMSELSKYEAQAYEAAGEIIRIAKPKPGSLFVDGCAHLNRAVVLEREAAEKYMLDEVNAVPRPKAGGSFPTALWGELSEPCTVEHVRAHLGLDIGSVMIGMQLREVAVPVRLEHNRIGEALVTAARTRPKFMGGGGAV